MPPRAGPTVDGAPRAGGSGFAAAAALSRGVADMSMEGGALGETMNGYEFKENEGADAQQSIDDLDDFERRLAGGGSAPRAAPPAAARKPPPARAPKGSAPRPMPTTGMAAAGAISGAEYVAAAKVAKAQARVPKSKKPTPDDEYADEAEDARQAMGDLNRFNDGLGDDDDD